MLEAPCVKYRQNDMKKSERINGASEGKAIKWMREWTQTTDNAPTEHLTEEEVQEKETERCLHSCNHAGMFGGS